MKKKKNQLHCSVCFVYPPYQIHHKKGRWKWICHGMSQNLHICQKNWKKCALGVIPLECTSDMLVNLHYCFNVAKRKICPLALKGYVL